MSRVYVVVSATIFAALVCGCGPRDVAQTGPQGAAPVTLEVKSGLIGVPSEDSVSLSVGQEVAIGQLGVTVEAVVIDRLSVSNFGSVELEGKSRLVVRLRYRCIDPKRIAQAPSLIGAARAKDNEGNELEESPRDYVKRIGKGFAITLRAGETGHDVLVFERPAASSSKVAIAIDGSRFEGGAPRLIINAGIGEKEPPPPAAKISREAFESLVMKKKNAEVTASVGQPDIVEAGDFKKMIPIRWRYVGRVDVDKTEAIITFGSDGKVSAIEYK